MKLEISFVLNLLYEEIKNKNCDYTSLRFNLNLYLKPSLCFEKFLDAKTRFSEGVWLSTHVIIVLFLLLLLVRVFLHILHLIWDYPQFLVSVSKCAIVLIFTITY